MNRVKLADRHKGKQIGFRPSEETFERLRQLKIAHPGWKKNKILEEAVKQMYEREFR